MISPGWFLLFISTQGLTYLPKLAFNLSLSCPSRTGCFATGSCSFLVYCSIQFGHIFSVFDTTWSADFYCIISIILWNIPFWNGIWVSLQIKRKWKDFLFNFWKSLMGLIFFSYLIFKNRIFQGNCSNQVRRLIATGFKIYCYSYFMVQIPPSWPNWT